MKHSIFKNCFFSIFPLKYTQLTDFTVVYDINDIFTTDYLIISNLDIYNEQSENPLFKNIKIDSIKKFYYLDIKEIKKELNKMNKLIINEESETLENISSKDIIKWDYNYLDIFKFREDNINKINIYYISSFAPKEPQSFIDIIFNCSLLFDSNTYPIYLISSLNNGGYGQISSYFLEIFFPLITSQIYLAFRKKDSLMKYFMSKNATFEDFNCKNEHISKFLNKSNKINYGNVISDSLTKLFVYNRKDIRGEIESFQLELKNKRKPTDLIAIDDGYSYSATSLFLKFLQYYGGGITVGYFQNPNKMNILFDSSLSPSSVLEHFALYEISEDYKNLYKKYQFIIQFAFSQTFYYPTKIDKPLEYEITPVDEIAPIYEFLDDNNYDIYIKTAKKILKKYENKCNLNNKKLVKATNKCDKYFKNSYTHGGYECGSNGKWSSKCAPSYCDIGYIFDYKQGKCIYDKCSKIEGRTEYEKDINDITLLIIILFSIVLSIIIIIIFIIFKFLKENKNDSDYGELPLNISLSIQDRNE